MLAALTHWRLVDWAAAALVFSCVAILLVRGVDSGIDFHVFYLSGQRILDGEAIYRPSDASMPFKYHPAWPLLFAVFALVPEPIANVIFNCLQLICWGWATLIWSKWLGCQITPIKFFLLVMVSLGALGTETRWVQINGSLFLGVTAIMSWTHGNSQRPLISGFVASLLCSLKLNFGLIAIYCLLKTPKSFIGMAAGAAILHTVVALAYGDAWSDDVYRAWLDLTLSQSSEQYSSPHAQGLLRALMSLMNDMAQLTWALSVIFFLLGGYVLSRMQPIRTEEGAYWLAGIFLLSPLAWWYQITFMLPMLYFLLGGAITAFERFVLYACMGAFAIINPELLGYWVFEYLGRQNILFWASTTIFLTFAWNVFMRKDRPQSTFRSPILGSQ